MIKFSIIVPVHNVEQFLPDCVDSLLTQTYSNFEVILIDDVSTDNSRKIAADYEKKYPGIVKLIVHEINTRQGGARNTGIEAATGDYILFIDSDDYIRSDALEILKNAIDQSNQADIIEFSFASVSENKIYNGRYSLLPRIQALGGADKPLLISTMSPWNKAYHAKLFAAPALRFPTNYFYEDYCLVPRLIAAANKVHYIDEDLYYYRQRAGSTVHSNKVERNRDVLACTDILLQYFNEHPLSENLKKQLEFLVVEHVLLRTTLRVMDADRRHPLINELKQYVQKHFPDYRNNPYRFVLPENYQRFWRYIENGQYTRLYLAWTLRNKITGTIKKILKRA